MVCHNARCLGNALLLKKCQDVIGTSETQLRATAAPIRTFDLDSKQLSHPHNLYNVITVSCLLHNCIPILPSTSTPSSTNRHPSPPDPPALIHPTHHNIKTPPITPLTMAASRPLILMGAGIAGGIGLLVYGRDDFKTPGIKNIENRHSAAGGAPSSTPARASKMGDQNSGAGRHGGNGELFLLFCRSGRFRGRLFVRLWVIRWMMRAAA